MHAVDEFICSFVCLSFVFVMKMDISIAPTLHRRSKVRVRIKSGLIQTLLFFLSFSPPSPSRPGGGVTPARGVLSSTPNRGTSCFRPWKLPSTCSGSPSPTDRPPGGARWVQRHPRTWTCPPYPSIHPWSRAGRHRCLSPVAISHNPLLLRSVRITSGFKIKSGLSE